MLSARRGRVVTLLLAALALLVVIGCGGDEGGSAGGEGEAASAGSGGTEVEVDGAGALVWGDGDYGVVLAHGASFDAASWEPLAQRIADQGSVALAVEDISPESILAAADYLRQEVGVEGVALLGGSAGADGILDAVSGQPEASDQLILLSPNSEVEGLGPQPKLLVASEGESVADVSRNLAASAAGDQNVAMILPGDAHAQNIFDTGQGEALTEAILERLERFSG
jgi:pimeloyl-ACP methyl ester carboxylesterase